ncbi:MAG: DUF6062 family protein [Lachnospiraceae bacterium]|nr:DUF6062 family protein [Lachnospiraceae bacterium]
MKEKLYTIPLNDAVNESDECPFCFIERKLEQDAIDFTIGSGSSYMESDIREQTDKIGFCRDHLKKMYDYGNTLGNALIMKTHYQRIMKEMHEQFASYTPGKTQKINLFHRKSQDGGENKNPIQSWTESKDCSCYICQTVQPTFERYIETFFYLYRQDEAFKAKILNGKGFCLHHFGTLCQNADHYLNEKERAEFYPAMFGVMEKNFARIEEDISWLVDKFDYRNRDADWKNSQDALTRGMQKLRGGYPIDPPYKAK